VSLHLFPSGHRPTKRGAIVEILEAEIGTQTWPVSSRLPTEAELIDRFGVSRQTLRYALSDLRARGLIESQQGKGWWVIRKSAVAEFSHSFQSIDELVDYSRSSTGKTVRTEDILLTEALAGRIGAGVGEPWRFVVTLRTASGQPAPMGLNTTWIPAANKGVFQAARKSGLPIFIELQKLVGKPISKVRQVCGASSADREQAKLLQCPIHEALLSIQRWYYTADDKLLGLSESLHPPSRFQYAVTVRHATLDQRNAARFAR
jgi:GntR family transcriptional regulator